MGAAFYEDDGCIRCGLCEARTEGEMIEASKKIRAYLRTHARKGGVVKKIAVCGKGGTGKSTVVTLMANVLREEGFTILVVDTDESNPSLYRMFGFGHQPRPLIKLLPKTPSGDNSPIAEWFKSDEISFQDIPHNYILRENQLLFLMVGKIEDPFQGCACSIADLTRDLIGKLSVNDREIVLIDMEAGIESFGRGVERNVDTVLIVVEASFESLALAEKINYMAEGIGISKVRAILNKVPSQGLEEKIINVLNKKNLKFIGTIYFDQYVNEAGFEGKALGESDAKESVRRIVKRLLAETE